MYRLPRIVVLLAALALPTQISLAAEKYNLGRTASPQEISGWDIDVRGDGTGLPPGKGSVAEGETLYNQRCVACHGDFGEGRGRWPQIAGGLGTLAKERPEKTVGSYWPFAPVLFDYIRRAMPFGAGMSMTTDETYAVTAYVLSLNDLLPSTAVLDARRLSAIKMPNAKGFIRTDNQKPDVAGQRCMKNCKTEIKVLSDQARELKVTPDQDLVSQNKRTAALVAASRGPRQPKPPAKPQLAAKPPTGDPARGKRVFSRCKTCHTANKGGATRVGPNLYGIFGQTAAAAKRFRYSPALTKSGLVWNEENLRRYLGNPRKVVPGTRMTFAGIRDRRALDDLISYLRIVTGASPK